ncbi:MAG: Tad domain-containing protein [Acidimicrobiales bacterium]|nr:Tad domain-containing protein [Acidimicrobiales bacterium]
MLNRLRPHRGEAGISLVLMSLLLVALLGMSALVVDVGGWQVEASNLQKAADAASLAGVVRLPDGEEAARERARQIAADNGYDHDNDPDVTVDVQVLGDEESLSVTITRTNVQQFFAQVVRDDPTTISRTSSSQYVQPVPLGSPRNYLGTNELMEDLVSGDGVENFYLAVSGKCTRREYGDRIAVQATRNSSSPHGCTPGNGTSIANPEYDQNGYLFGVTVPDTPGSTPVAIQMFDPPVCVDDEANEIFGEHQDGIPEFDVEVTVRRYDDLDPLDGTHLDEGGNEVGNGTVTFGGEDDESGLCRFDTSDDQETNGDNALLECQDDNRLRECWHTLATVNQPGNYTVQVNPLFADGNTRHDIFSLRAKTGAIFDPCTSDETVPAGSDPAFLDTCAQVYGLTHLPIYAREPAGTTARFFLASIDERHNSKTMQVTFYDTAEGADNLRLVNPVGDYVNFTWEILCSNGDSAPCTPPENDPYPGGPGARSGGPTSVLDVSNPDLDADPDPDGVPPGYRTYSSNVQSGKYSDRLIRLTVELPDDIADVHEGRTWWKVEYNGDFSGDRTTWTVQLLGDPVRLVPNAPPGG